jgi:hypothetical protein
MNPQKPPKNEKKGNGMNEPTRTLKDGRLEVITDNLKLRLARWLLRGLKYVILPTHEAPRKKSGKVTA